MNKELIKRLLISMDDKGYKKADLANITKISPSSISDWLTGKYSPKQDKIYLLASALDVSPAWLMGNGKISDKDLFTPNLESVPMLGYSAAGEPLENMEGQDTYFVQVDSKYKVDFCITIKGDSMINANINDGDIVFVRKQSEVENGQIACVEIDRCKVCIKRFYKTENGVMLVSENPKYAPMQFNETNCDDLRILGLAILKQSEIH